MRKHGKQLKRKSASSSPNNLPKPSRRQMRREASRARWRTWDWSKRDVELAAEKGLSHERIRQIRQLLRAPRSPYHHLHSVTVTALKWAKANLDKLQGLTFDEIQERGRFRLGRGGLFHQFLKKQKVLRDGRRNRKHPWDLMNFSLPSSDLERIWKTPLNMAASYRCRKHLGPPRWSHKHGVQILKQAARRGAYLRSLKAEEQKAQRYLKRGLAPKPV